MALGAQEILLLLILLGIPVVIAGVAIFLSRRSGGTRVAELEAENRRLREELDEREERR